MSLLKPGRSGSRGKTELLNLRKIWEYFLSPLVKRKRSASGIIRYLETYVFCTNTRFINRYLVKKEFNLPGILFLAPNVKVQGIGKRRMRPGVCLVVRVDEHNPGVYEVQPTSGNQKIEQVFQLTYADWRAILPNLELLDTL